MMTSGYDLDCTKNDDQNNEDNKDVENQKELDGTKMMKDHENVG